MRPNLWINKWICIETEKGSGEMLWRSYQSDNWACSKILFFFHCKTRISPHWHKHRNVWEPTCVTLSLLSLPFTLLYNSPPTHTTLLWLLAVNEIKIDLLSACDSPRLGGVSNRLQCGGDCCHWADNLYSPWLNSYARNFWTLVNGTILVKKIDRCKHTERHRRTVLSNKVYTIVIERDKESLLNLEPW